MKDFALRIYNKIRFGFNPKIKTHGNVCISPKSEVIIQGTFDIGNGVVTECSTYLSSTGNGVLCLGSKVYINRNTCIVAKESIRIGNYVDIGPNVCIFDHDHDDKSETGFVTAPIVIGNRVWIGSNCTILKGVTIGDNCTIAAGSVITHNVPSNSIVYQKRVDTIVKR